MRGIGYEPEEARILADHVMDAALCGYEYSGLPKLLNVADHPRFQDRRSPMRVLRETSVSVLFDGGNQSGMLGMYYATRAVIERRLDVARRELQSIDRYRHTVVNDDVDQAVNQLCEILQSYQNT